VLLYVLPLWRNLGGAAGALPLFNQVGREHFSAYAQRHTRWISPVVAPAMLLEAATAILALYQPVPGTPYRLWFSGALLVLVIWWATVGLSVPQHHKLQFGFNEAAYRKLVRTNWLRTVAWSLRSLLLLVALLYLLLPLNTLNTLGWT
jgi:hypothetical protein